TTKNPMRVVDEEKTARILAKYIPMDESDILDKLHEKGKYQVEFGAAGKNISTETKAKIDKENLPGIEFTRQSERFYPNGTFA
ncbi:penicillin-binding protein, partial [Xanthomonas citri pv. citri]|nr:penicillin-binding protein [Xanthomonas citri pv. citri]